MSDWCDHGDWSHRGGCAGQPAPHPAPLLAWCPLCELPRARQYTIKIAGEALKISASESATRFMAVLPHGVRAIPMTENHDPGDEDRS